MIAGRRKAIFIGIILAGVVLALAVVPHHPYLSREAVLRAACPPGCGPQTKTKLMRLSDLARYEPSIAAGEGQNANTYVWVVASEGQATGFNGGSGWPWTMEIIKDEPGTPHLWIGLGLGGDGYVPKPIETWPSFWDRLPDYGH
ncbi:MAG TPA: hypothetical protein VLS53_01710 [Candidatus Dormibacteraeota bacterium]|nr:hypothetical protein [Candidatus Dormibacteraeota bacterium]